MADSYSRPENVVTAAEFRILISRFGGLRACSVGTSRTFSLVPGQKTLIASNDTDRMLNVSLRTVFPLGNASVQFSPTDSSFAGSNAIQVIIGNTQSAPFVLKPSQQLWAQVLVATRVVATQVSV